MAEEKTAAELEAAKLAEVEQAKVARAADLQKEIDRLKKKLDAKDAEEEKAKQALLIEQGKHKELAELKQKELDAITPELEQLRAERKARIEAEEAEKKTLLTKLPEVKRAIYANASVDVLRDVTGAPPRAPKGDKPGETGGNQTLRDQYLAAEKIGDVVKMVTLTRQIAEAEKAA